MALRILSRWLRWPSSDEQPQQDTSWQRDGSKPDWLVSRNRFKAGTPVTEDIASSVNDDSIIKNGIAQRNLDVIVLQKSDYVSSIKVHRRDAGFQQLLFPKTPLSYHMVEDYDVLCLSTGIDYDRIRDSISQFRENEWIKTKSLFRKYPPVGIRFIDCHSDSIQGVNVKASDVDFVALSYVWGTPKAEDRTSATNDGHDNIPLTIRDAMVVVRKLGFRYLWIDKYCIDDSNKHQMISRMGDIYQSAVVTIVAALGDDPSHGLSGVSRMRHLEYEGGIIITKDPLAEIKASRWSTRGWTYQEGALSPCCLTFTPTQWLLKCEYQMVVETTKIAVPWSPFSRDSPRKELYILDAINRYACRDLTYPSDSLSAFLGILGDWQSSYLSHVSHLSGVPFGETNHQYLKMALFLHGIFWGCRRTNLVRVPSIPSWTWAGWRGFTEQDSPYGMFTFEEALLMYSEIVDAHVHLDRRYDLRDYSAVNATYRNGDLVDKIQMTGWSIRLKLPQLSDFQVHWDSLEFRDQHEDGSLVMLVLSWQSWSGADKRWRLLVLGRRPGADDLYHRLGRVVWHAPNGLKPKDIVIDGQRSERRTFTLV